jgi:hypothetical protein
MMIERQAKPLALSQSSKKALVACLSEPDSVPLDFDILEFLYMVRTSDDLDLLLKAIDR